MTVVTYAGNVDPRDGTQTITVRVDSAGNPTLQLKVGDAADLSASEIARVSQFAILTQGGTPISQAASGSLLNYTGAWKPNTLYHQNDVVLYQGAIYVAGSIFTSGSVFNTSNWTALSDANRIPASGDTTGATDRAAIQAAIGGGATTVILGANPTVQTYYIDVALALASDVTLVVWDATVRLVAGANTNILQNSNRNATGNTNIYVVGVGHAVLDGNAVNQVRQAGDWQNAGLLFINVVGFKVAGVDFLNTNFAAYMFQVCQHGRIHHTDITQDDSGPNQGGFEVGPGCNDIYIDGVTGTIFDDLLDVAAFSTGDAAYMHPYTASLSSSARNSNFVTIRNVDYSGEVAIRCLNGDTNTVSYVFGENIHNRNPSSSYAMLTFGPALYAGGGGAIGAPAGGSISEIGLRNVTRVGSGPLVSALSHAQNVVVDGFQLGGATNLLTDTGSLGGFVPTLNRFVIQNGQVATMTNSMSKLSASSTPGDITFDEIHLGSSQAILDNAASVAGLYVSGVRIGTLNNDALKSTGTSTGRIKEVSYAAIGGTFTAFYKTPTGLQIGPGMPTLKAADATPSAVYGSEIVCDYTKDPTGAGGTTGGKYIGNGEQWAKAVDLGGFQPGQPNYPLLFHFDASAITGVANGGAVATWLDRTVNGRNLTQATGAAQPTWVQTDTHLNSKSSVAFNGTSQFLQSAALASSIALPITFFIVYYYSSVVTANTEYVIHGEVATGTAPIVYKLPTNNFETLYDGSANFSGAAVAATTPYITYALFNGSGSYTGRNKAAQSSVSGPGSPGSNPMTGLTVGARYDGTSPGPINVAEIFAYNAIISAADYATIVSWLAGKYGITLT